MPIDTTGVMLIPGDQGRLCPGNGENPAVECCCDACDHFLLCYPQWDRAGSSATSNPASE